MKKYLLLLICIPFAVNASTAIVEVDTGTNTINALEGTLSLPQGMKVRKVLTGNSAILFWVELPKLSTSTVSFSGITPGGIMGKKQVLTLEGTWQSTDLTKIVSKSHAYLNDGKGTEARVNIKVVESEPETDVLPPEVFIPSVSTSTDLFNGVPFLVFSAQDKGTGVDHYEVALTYLFPPSQSDWVTAESPLQLDQASLHKKIYIKAVDSRGNQRIVVFKSDSYNRVFKEALILAILILVSLILLLRKLWAKHSNQHFSS